MFSRKKALKKVGILILITISSACQNLGLNLRHIAAATPAAAPTVLPVAAPPAKRLQDYDIYKYEVLFSDPLCGPYKYTAGKEPTSVGGVQLTQKPTHVYCKNKYDLTRSGARSESPQYRIIEWINDPNTTEIYFTYLSFRNKAVKNALCIAAAAPRKIKIRFVLSVSEDQSTADELVKCGPHVEKKTRGLENGLGYAHNKFFIVNPYSTHEFKIIFSSGNMTSGPVIHHENWNFITTVVDSHFAQAHLCALESEWDDAYGKSRAAYMKHIRECRAAIKIPEETDIKVFFIPGEGEPEDSKGKKPASAFLLDGDNGFPGINSAKKIWLACHRFLYTKMIAALTSRMSGYNYPIVPGEKKKSLKPPELKIVADDDTYYKTEDATFTKSSTLASEYFKMQALQKLGAELEFMETNSDEGQLHHSKYLIFADYNNAPSANPIDDFKALFVGSANLTGAGFNKNWENSYYVTIPEVVRKFAEHYDYTWTKLATPISRLPKVGVVTNFLEDKPDSSQ